jgi:hypothetical protein
MFYIIITAMFYIIHRTKNACCKNIYGHNFFCNPCQLYFCYADFNFSHSYKSDYAGSLPSSGRNLPPLSSEATLQMKATCTSKLFSFLLSTVHCTLGYSNIYILCAQDT